jgi:hypothetical protein
VGELGGLRGKSSDMSSKNHGGVGSASGSGEMIWRSSNGEDMSVIASVGW